MERALVGTLPGGQAALPKFNPRLALRSFQSWVSAAIGLNSRQVACTPLRLYARKEADSLYATKGVPFVRKDRMLGGSGAAPSQSVLTKAVEMGEDFVEVVESHPAKTLLREVNPYLGGFDLLTLLCDWAQSTGNGYLAPVFGSFGVPDEVWPLQPDMVWAVRGRERLIDGWLFGRTQGDALRLDTDAVLHFKLPNPRDPIYGLGKIEEGWMVVQQNEAAHEADYSLAANNMRPDYAVILKNGGSEKQMDGYLKRIERRLRGTAKRGEALAFSGDVTIQPLQWPPKDMSDRQKMVEEIAAVIGVPVPLLLMNDANLASATTGFAAWKEGTILPLCRALEDFLNQRWLPLFKASEDSDETLADYAMFCFDDPVPKNREIELRENTDLPGRAVMTYNEVRVKRLGMEKSDDPMADRLLYNGQLLGAVTAPVQMIGAPGFAASAPGDGVSPVEADPDAPTNSAPPKPNAAGASSVPGDAAVTDTALNGAQVTSLLELLRAAQSGELPVEAARLAALSAFPLVPRDTIASMFAALKPREFVEDKPQADAPKPNEAEPEDDDKAVLRRIAKMVDDHNAKHGDAVTLSEAVEVYAGAA